MNLKNLIPTNKWRKTRTSCNKCVVQSLKTAKVGSICPPHLASVLSFLENVKMERWFRQSSTNCIYTSSFERKVFMNYLMWYVHICDTIVNLLGFGAGDIFVLTTTDDKRAEFAVANRVDFGIETNKPT